MDEALRSRTPTLTSPKLKPQNHPAVIGAGALRLGTDQHGRDILARVIDGAKLSLAIGIFPVLISTVIGSRGLRPDARTYGGEARS